MSIKEILDGRRFIRDETRERIWYLTYRTLHNSFEPFSESELKLFDIENKLKEIGLNIRKEPTNGCLKNCNHIVIAFDDDADEAEFIVKMSCD
jgi:hypothetical protein